MKDYIASETLESYMLQGFSIHEVLTMHMHVGSEVPEQFVYAQGFPINSIESPGSISRKVTLIQLPPEDTLVGY